MNPTAHSIALQQPRLTVKEAAETGYIALTNPYEPTEMTMLQAAADQLERDEIEHRIVQTDEGPELWRRYGFWTPPVN
jgi:hypothetical protein